MNREVMSGQVSIEYLLIIGFVTFFVVVVLGTAFFYSGSIRDSMRVTQVNNYANKIISTSESVFYSGEPSKATVSVYLPQGVESVEISNNNLIVAIQTSSGTNKMAFSSKVPISLQGNLTASSGLKKIQIIAETNTVTVSQV